MLTFGSLSMEFYLYLSLSLSLAFHWIFFLFFPNKILAWNWRRISFFCLIIYFWLIFFSYLLLLDCFRFESVNGFGSVRLLGLYVKLRSEKNFAAKIKFQIEIFFSWPKFFNQIKISEIWLNLIDDKIRSFWSFDSITSIQRS